MLLDKSIRSMKRDTSLLPEIHALFCRLNVFVSSSDIETARRPTDIVHLLDWGAHMLIIFLL